MSQDSQLGSVVLASCQRCVVSFVTMRVHVWAARQRGTTRTSRYLIFCRFDLYVQNFIQVAEL